VQGSFSAQGSGFGVLGSAYWVRRTGFDGTGFGVLGSVSMSQMQDLFFISIAARMLGMHPQTLRKYERLGLVQPTRTIGSMRLYSREELERLKLIKRLVDDGGINLAGVQRLLSIAEVVQRLRPLMRDEALSARDTRRRVAQELEELSRMLGFD
jgi:MerR family transcriptional regulator/heat shock protein HspR